MLTLNNEQTICAHHTKNNTSPLLLTLFKNRQHQIIEFIIHNYLFMYEYIYTNVCISTYINVCVCLYVYMSICLCMRSDIYAYVCQNVNVLACFTNNDLLIVCYQKLYKA